MPWTFYKADGQAKGSPGIGWTFYKADGSTLAQAAAAATATLATSITASANNSTDETTYPTFVDGATGTQGIETDTGLTYNPSSGILTATQFTGALSGNATTSTTATTATNVTASANNSTDETVYPTFVDGATGGQGIETDTGFTYNPNSGILTATQFTGGVNGNATSATTAVTATNVTASANNSTDETVYPTFVDGATGGQGIETDTGFTYNPSSGLLTITGELDAGSLDISGDADIDGTLEADAITIDGTNVITGSLITTLGTVTAGTWEGTTVAVDQGGTGATALTNLITLGTHTTGNYAATVANATNGGTTVSNSGSETAAITIALNLNDLTAAAVNVAADSIAILDADGNVTRKESIADLATAMAGSNLTASSGQLVAGAAGAGLGLVIALS